MADFLFPELEADHQNTKQVAELKQARKLSRSSDPETSQEAALRVLAAAKEERERYVDAVYTLFRKAAGGPTAAECAKWLYPDATEAELYKHFQTANRRLADSARTKPDDKAEYPLKHGPPRKCQVKNSKCVTWEPT